MIDQQIRDYYFPQQIYQFYLWYLGDYCFRRTPILMLSQQMRSCDSIKIEAVAPSATSQLNDESCRLLLSAPEPQYS